MATAFIFKRNILAYFIAIIGCAAVPIHFYVIAKHYYAVAKQLYAVPKQLYAVAKQLNTVPKHIYAAAKHFYAVSKHFYAVAKLWISIIAVEIDIEHSKTSKTTLMLEWNIPAILLAKGITKPYAWLRSTGVSHNVAHRLVTGKHHRVDKLMISKICTAAYCTPNDLFVWQPDGKHIIEEAHPLNALKARAISTLADKLKKMTVEQIAELERVAGEMEEKD